MAKIVDVNVLKAGEQRIFVQSGGIHPKSPFRYYGLASLEGLEKPLKETEAIMAPSRERRNEWDTIDQVEKAAGLGTSSFSQLADRYMGDIWWGIKETGETFNIQIVNSREGRPDNFNTWDSKIALIDCKMTSLNLSQVNPRTGDDNEAVQISGELSWEDMVRIRRITFSEKAGVAVNAEILDGDYAPPKQTRGNVVRHEYDRQFWLRASVTTPTPEGSAVIHTKDGSTYTATVINSIGTAGAAALAVVGDHVVVIQEAPTLQYHYASLDSLDNGDADPFTAMASGFVATKAPRCIYSKSGAESWIGGKGGYIYFLGDVGSPVTVVSDGTGATQDVNAIDGYGRVVVAVGQSNSVQYSNNNGEAFTAVVGPEPGANLTAVAVIDEDVWLVGTSTGKLYVSLNQGETWELTSFPAVTAIEDIYFYDDIAGFVAATVSGAGRVYRTTDGGNTWTYQAPIIQGLPANTRINVVVSVGHNNVAAGGLVSGGDGLIAVAN